MKAPLLGVASLATCVVPEPSLELVRNSSFDAWCDDAPCDWEVEGRVEQTSTWSSEDPGVAFDGPGALRQDLGDAVAPWRGISCLEGEVLVDGTPELTLELDFDSDGRVEWSRDVRGGSWFTDGFRVRVPLGTRSLALRLANATASAHTIGHVRLVGSQALDCPPLSSIQTLGTPCRGPAECGDLHCVDVGDLEERWSSVDWSFVEPTVCSACASHEDCGGGEICGGAWGAGPRLARACVPAASAGLGETCGLDEQCASGVCCHGRCAECCADGPCGDDTGQCRARTTSLQEVPKLLSVVCESGPRSTGAACLDDADCAGTCTGPPLRVCLDDGRTCEVDGDCPGTESDRCTIVGVRHGRCE